MQSKWIRSVLMLSTIAILLTASSAWCQGGAEWIQATNLPEWSPRSGHASVVFKDKMWILGGYYGGGRRNDVWSSSDGTTWEEVKDTLSPQIWLPRSEHTAVAFEDKLWVLGGYDGEQRLNDVWCSQDGGVWMKVEPMGTLWSPRSRHSSIVFNDHIWVIGGYDGEKLLSDVWCSADGVNWHQMTKAAQWSARHYHTSVVFGDKMWVIGGDDSRQRCNDVWYSWDGAFWIASTKRADWTARYLHAAVVHNDKMWVIGGHGASVSDDLADVWFSDDGNTWTRADTDQSPHMWSARSMHTSLVYHDKMWVIGGGAYARGRKNDVWMSEDGSRWEQATRAADWPVRDRHTSIVHDDRIWVIGGFGGNVQYNDVWWSRNGLEWHQAATVVSARMWTPRYSHGTVSFDGKLWVIGGCDVDGLRQDVWYSKDGAVWDELKHDPTDELFSARHHHATAVFLSKMWILGGRDGNGLCNDVWTSWDGEHWRRISEAAPWSPREHHAVVPFSGRLYLLGGNDVQGRRNDVWYTYDGANWTQADTGESKNIWSPRSSHAAVSAAGNLWVIGGYDDEGLNDEVWASSDGEKWNWVARHAPWAAREDHGAVYHQGKIFVLGGFSENLMNDVWYTVVDPEAAAKAEKKEQERKEEAAGEEAAYAGDAGDANGQTEEGG